MSDHQGCVMGTVSEAATDAGGQAAGETRRQVTREGTSRDVRDLRATVTGIVLAGTQSWGACPLERVVPRTLAPVVNCPLIFHVLDWLDRGGIRAAAICGSHTTRTLRKSLSNGHGARIPDGMRIDYYHDIAPRGPAGCVRDAGYGSTFDACVVVDGTILPHVDLTDLLKTHEETGAAITVVVSTDGPAAGLSHDSLTPVGIYVFSGRSLKHVPPAGYQDIKETLVPRLYQCGESVLTYRTDAPVPRISGVDSYMAVNEWALTRLVRQGEHLSGYRSAGESRVHLSATVDSTAKLVGPILVGARSRIERGATLIGPITIGENSIIKERAVVCRTSIWDDAVIGAGTVVDRCIVTSRAVVNGEVPHRYVVASQPRSRMRGVLETRD